MSIADEIRKAMEEINKQTKDFHENEDINYNKQLDEIFSLFKDKLGEEFEKAKKSSYNSQDNSSKSSEDKEEVKQAISHIEDKILNITNEQDKLKESINETQKTLLDMQKQIDNTKAFTEEKLEIINKTRRDQYILVISIVNMVLLIVTIIINLI